MDVIVFIIKRSLNPTKCHWKYFKQSLFYFCINIDSFTNEKCSLRSEMKMCINFKWRLAFVLNVKHEANITKTKHATALIKNCLTHRELWQGDKKGNGARVPFFLWCCSHVQLGGRVNNFCAGPLVTLWINLAARADSTGSKQI